MRWYRNHITTKAEYDNLFDESEQKCAPSDVQKVEIFKSKKETAFEIAADIRKFEIEMFWKRAAFFWAFIAAIYTAYFQVLTEIYKNKHGTFALVALSVLGLFFCFSWLLSSIGSKHWQTNWEDHIDLLEDDVTGSLYKTYRTGSFSESKIVIVAGWVVTAFAYGLLLYEVANMAKAKIPNAFCDQILFTMLIAICVPFLLFCYAQFVKGNLSNTGKIDFSVKQYEGAVHGRKEL